VVHHFFSNIQNIRRETTNNKEAIQKQNPFCGVTLCEKKGLLPPRCCDVVHYFLLQQHAKHQKRKREVANSESDVHKHISFGVVLVRRRRRKRRRRSITSSTCCESRKFAIYCVMPSSRGESNPFCSFV
jgi:hypothetical protein